MDMTPTWTKRKIFSFILLMCDTESIHVTWFLYAFFLSLAFSFIYLSPHLLIVLSYGPTDALSVNYNMSGPSWSSIQQWVQDAWRKKHQVTPRATLFIFSLFLDLCTYSISLC